MSKLDELKKKFMSLSGFQKAAVGVVVLFVATGILSANSEPNNLEDKSAPAIEETEEAVPESESESVSEPTESPSPTKSTKPNTSASAPAAAAPAPSKPAAAAPAPSNESVSQKNARLKAQSYLRSSSFSRQGLIDQVVYEGFSTEDATYGVDANGTDWRAQSVLKAKSYLRSSSFSRQGLIEQLEYEDFSPEDSVYGTDSSGADWMAQAAAKAASYLRSSSFSRQGLYDQLIYEGFTPEQIEKAKAAWIQKRKTTLGDESGFAPILVNALYDGQDFEAMEALDQKVKAVDVRQATSVLKKYVTQSNILWAVGKGL
jgi:hypothetical protein